MRNPITHPARRRVARGFTLVEVLIALVVLSIGLLGIAALYLETLRANRTALFRTHAVTLTADLADRIRANRNPAGAYACAAPCNPASGGNAIAIGDLTQWIALVQAQLPGGAGSVTYVSDGIDTTPDVYTIAVFWTEVGQADPVSYQLRMEI
jgi:type IV pilus assembly protein PilV